MPNLRNGSKGGFEPGLTRLRVRHSTALVRIPVAPQAQTVRLAIRMVNLGSSRVGRTGRDPSVPSDRIPSAFYPRSVVNFVLYVFCHFITNSLYISSLVIQ